MAVPVRTCLGCGNRFAQADLIRYVWGQGGPQVDPRRQAPGRGAYHCDNDRCKDRFQRGGKRLKRAFRLS